MKKKLMILLLVVTPLILSAKLNNIENGKAKIMGFKYSQDLRAAGASKDDNISDLCISSMEKDQSLKDKSQEFLQVVYNSCYESLSR